MKEQQAVLDFFAQTENLPLGLAVAEQMDALREQMNTRFWQQLHQRLADSIKTQGLAWQVAATDDRNVVDCLVGVHCSPIADQEICLRMMAEQQLLGNDWRIYYGLMWSTAPSPAQQKLPAVLNLKEVLQKAGFRSNENFLAWQWTELHPRRQDFLLRYAGDPEQTLVELENLLKELLLGHREAIEHANAALKNAPHSLSASLKQLRDELLDQTGLS